VGKVTLHHFFPSWKNVFRYAKIIYYFPPGKILPTPGLVCTSAENLLSGKNALSMLH